MHHSAIGAFQLVAKVLPPSTWKLDHMNSKPYPSIAAIGDRVGRLICGHVDLAFRDIMPGTGVEINRHFVRLVTGKPHPFGNFACMGDPADLEATMEAGGPLLGCRAPSAEFFTGLVPEAVAQELNASGFQRHGGLPAVAVEIEKLSTTALPAGYAFARVGSAAQRDAWTDVFARG